PGSSATTASAAPLTNLSSVMSNLWEATMTVGFTVKCLGPHVEFHLFGEKAGVALPLVTLAQDGDLHAVLLGRLYYHGDALARLPAELAELASSGDPGLALAAYRHGGADGIPRLEGDFALVLWDAGRQVLLGIRDAMGGYPLFWARHQGTIAFSTSQRSLMD